MDRFMGTSVQSVITVNLVPRHQHPAQEEVTILKKVTMILSVSDHLLNFLWIGIKALR